MRAGDGPHPSVSAATSWVESLVLSGGVESPALSDSRHERRSRLGGV